MELIYLKVSELSKLEGRRYGISVDFDSKGNPLEYQLSWLDRNSNWEFETAYSEDDMLRLVESKLRSLENELSTKSFFNSMFSETIEALNNLTIRD